MNDHSRRLVEAVFKAIRRYEDWAVDEEELLRDIEGISEAIEEQDVQNLVSQFPYGGRRRRHRRLGCADRRGGRAGRAGDGRFARKHDHRRFKGG